MKYKVLCTGVENKRGRYEQGEIVAEKNFPKKVLKWWDEIGRIEKVDKNG